jgi:hypothetical protein
MIRRVPHLVVALVLLAPPVLASDHADPILLDDLEAGITDLFAFPRGDNLVLVLCVRRALTTGLPIDLEPYTYRLNLDLTTEVEFDDADARARYGGKVATPGSIAPDVRFELALSNDAELTRKDVSGLPDPTAVRFWSGVRDDPFIFFRFSRSNVIAMVLEVPFSQFPADQQDFLIWATSESCGRQIDHVGRSLRTMLPRFDFLNTLPPDRHVAALRARHESPGVLQDVLAKEASPFAAYRHYDFEPDVMIFTRRYAAGYPNGRLLEDDVARLTCEQGDCLLFEVSIADAHEQHQSRPTANDKPFLPEFPYLAEPHEERPPNPPPRLRTRTLVILGAAGLGLALALIVPWILLWRCRRRLARLRSSMR